MSEVRHNVVAFAPAARVLGVPVVLTSGREPAPGTQAALRALIRAWAASGTACPAR